MYSALSVYYIMCYVYIVHRGSAKPRNSRVYQISFIADIFKTNVFVDINISNRARYLIVVSDMKALFNSNKKYQNYENRKNKTA